MAERFLLWLFTQHRPREGWLPHLLLLAAVSCLTASVSAADWVPEGGVVRWTATLGLLLGVVLARRRMPAWAAWALLLAYGLLLTTLRLAGLWPLTLPFGGWARFSLFTRQHLALFADRWAGWIQAVFSGGSSQETVVFASGLGFLAWLLAAYLGWSAFRQRRPLLGLTVLGVALAINSYYSATSIGWVVAFVGLAALSAATLNYADLERTWQENDVSYSDMVRAEVVLMAGAVALGLLLFSFAIPAIHLRQLSRWVLERPGVHQVEESLQRAFAGVRQPQQGGLAQGQGGTVGVFPRDFLLGDAPELYETVVMTATVQSPIPQPRHWRALSFDSYTGRGWALSPEREEEVAAGSLIPLPPASQAVTITQEVAWLLDDRLARYTLGQPLSFDQATTVFWRGLDDQARVQGAGSNHYLARSQASAATPAELRRARLVDVPPVLVARYTALPQEMPARVGDLARQITAGLATPYDQAKAIEAFLRQYPYSLEVPRPPLQRDPVDYFLFELQKGYCDYYASAMVVLARSIGLPARLGIGYLAQAPDERGVETVRQINAHSWAELYFAGYGWVEFEPTAAFPLTLGEGALAVEEADPLAIGEPAPTPPPIPRPERSLALPWPWLAAAALFLLAGIFGWWRRPWRGDGAAIPSLYARLGQQASRLGLPTPPSQTPLEFAAALSALLARWEQQARLAPLARRVRQGALRLTWLFVRRQYAGKGEDEQATGQARAIWGEIRRPLWALRLLRRVWRP